MEILWRQLTVNLKRVLLGNYVEIRELCLHPLQSYRTATFLKLSRFLYLINSVPRAIISHISTPQGPRVRYNLFLVYTQALHWRIINPEGFKCNYNSFSMRDLNKNLILRSVNVVDSTNEQTGLRDVQNFIELSNSLRVDNIKWVYPVFILTSKNYKKINKNVPSECVINVSSKLQNINEMYVCIKLLFYICLVVYSCLLYKLDMLLIVVICFLIQRYIMWSFHSGCLQ